MGNMARHRSLRILLLALSGVLLSACHGSGGSSTSTSASASPVANHATRALAATPTTGLAPWGTYRPSVSTTTAASTSTTSTAAPGSVTLSWTPPTQNTDGSTLTNLAGYYIDYGTAPGTYTNSIQVANPGLASYVVQNLTAGTYYFVVTAYNTDGTQSTYSQQVSVAVD